jgi:GNAT superfamily N-acetyltransferase
LPVTFDPRMLAAGNAAAFWTALGTARGCRLIRRPGLLAVDGGGRYGRKVIVLSPSVSPDDVRELAVGPVRVEDAFGAVIVDGLSATTMPVMIRRPAPAPPPSLPVEPVTTEDGLAGAERIVVDGFPLPDFQPYRRGEVLPAGLLSNDTVAVFRVGDAGAALTIDDPAAVGIYWVTTMPEHRSRGVGRSLMHAALARVPDRPMTLTASRAGRALYESLGFRFVTESVWWT